MLQTNGPLPPRARGEGTGTGPVSYCAVVETEPAPRPDDVAVTVIWPGAPVDWTMAITLPLNAFRVSD